MRSLLCLVCRFVQMVCSLGDGSSTMSSQPITDASSRDDTGLPALDEDDDAAEEEDDADESPYVFR